MISTSALVHMWGAPDPGPNRHYAAVVSQAGCDEYYDWGDSVTVKLCERTTRTVTKGIIRRHPVEVTEIEVVRSAYRSLSDVHSTEEAMAIVVAMCKELVEAASRDEIHARAVDGLAARINGGRQ